MSRSRSAFDQWMYADGANSASDPLTDEQQALFDRGYRQCEAKVLRVAKKVVGEDEAEEIVQGAIIWLTHLVTRREDRHPMPADECEFGKRLVGLVYLIGKASVSTSDTERSPLPAHTCWGAELPRKIRNKPERLLAHDMEEFDEVTTPVPDDVEDETEKEKRLYYLREILIFAAVHLTLPQIEALLDHVRGTPRAEAAARRGISVKTFDNTLAFAKARMHYLVLCTELIEDTKFPVVSDWMETFWEMEERKRPEFVAYYREFLEEEKAKIKGKIERGRMKRAA